MKVVVDTNVLISALINPYGKPAHILKLIIMGKLDMALDERILGEYKEVALRPKFNLPSKEVHLILDFLRTNAIIPLPYEGAVIQVPDVDDTVFVEVALAGNADVIITGNKKHFPFKSIQKIKILNPEEFLSFFRKVI